MFSTNVFAEREAKTQREKELLRSVATNEDEDAKLAISKGVAVDIIDKYERSLLMLAIQNENFELVKLLIQKGADPNYEIPYTSFVEESLRGKRVLDFGVMTNNTQMVNLLERQGAQFSSKKIAHDKFLEQSKRKEEERNKRYEARQKEQAEEARDLELKIFYFCVFALSFYLLFRKKIPVFCKFLVRKIKNRPIAFPRLIGKLKQLKLQIPTINKTKKQQQQTVVDKVIVNEPKHWLGRGWEVDDTVALEVNYLTIEDIINPIRMTNQHERYVREMIWYIRKIEKTNANKKEASDILTAKWKLVNSKLVRSVYKRSLLLILENYSKQNLQVSQLVKQVRIESKMKIRKIL